MTVGILRLLGGLFSQQPSVKPADTASERAAKGGNSDERWVVILTTFDLVEAQIAVARLDDEDIPAHLRREAASSALPVNIGILGRIEVLAAESKAEQAVNILKDTLGYADEDDEVGEEQ